MQRPGTEREIPVEVRVVVCSLVNSTVTNVHFLVLLRVHGSVRSYWRGLGADHALSFQLFCRTKTIKATEEKKYWQQILKFKYYYIF